MSKSIERIAIVSDSFPPLSGGGVTSSHFNLFSAFKKKGYTVKAFTYGDGGHRLREEDVVRAGMAPFLAKIIRIIVAVFFKMIRDKGAAYQFSDAVVCSLGALSLPWKIRRFKPDIIVTPDHGAPGAFFPEFKNSKVVFISHHNPMRFVGESLFGVHSAMDAGLALKLEKMALSKADGVLCPSNYMKEVFLKTYPFTGPIDVIPNIVDTLTVEQVDRTPLRKNAYLPEDAPIAYIPSAGSVYKGSRFVFEIIRRLAAGYGQTIGFYLSGDISAELKRSLEFVPKNVRLIMPGKISYKDNISNIKACSICISPTLVENFSMAILEAQLCGLPVVTFDVGGNRDICIDGKTGFVTPFMDVEGLISFSAKLLSDRRLCSEMGEEARKLMMTKNNTELIADKFIDFFESLTRDKQSI